MFEWLCCISVYLGHLASKIYLVCGLNSLNSHPLVVAIGFLEVDALIQSLILGIGIEKGSNKMFPHTARLPGRSSPGPSEPSMKPS